MNWVVKPLPNEEIERLANAVGVSPLLARLLLVRGLGDSEEALRFLHPKIEHLHEPDRMQGPRESRRTPPIRRSQSGENSRLRRL